MRPLEVLLLLANLLAFLVMTVASTGAAQRMRHAPTGALAIALAQVLVEGARWQMTPAYMLAGLFWLLSLRPRLWPAVEPAGAAPCGRLGAALAIGLGLLGLALSAAMPMLIPVFRFPAPTGPFGIGTLTYHWVDSARPELFAADPAQRRALMVQIWYPSRGARSAGHAPYLPDAGAVTSAFARI